MKRKKGRQKLKLSIAQPKIDFHDRMRLTSFAEKIVTDATNNGIEQIHISSGKVKILSETIDRNKIIVMVPSNAQSIFLRNYINRASSNKNPFHVEITKSTDFSRMAFRGLRVNVKSAGISDGDGTGKRRGIKPPRRLAGSSNGGDGTGGRHGKTPPETKY